MESTSLKTERGREIRELWTNELRQKLSTYSIDFAIFAGFTLLTNITSDYLCLNVHPGDLSYLKDGQRYLIGMHNIPIERAILEGHSDLRSSVILAEPYAGEGANMDSGLILSLSPKVSIDLQEHSLENLQSIYDERVPGSRIDDPLRDIARENLDRLKTHGDWVVFPKTVVDFAKGHYAIDGDRQLHFYENNDWQAVKLK